MTTPVPSTANVAEELADRIEDEGITDTDSGTLLLTNDARLWILRALQRAEARALREALRLPFHGALVPPTGPYVLVSDLMRLESEARARADAQEPQR